MLFRSGSIGWTLEQLDTYGSIEAVPASLDSRIWTGNGKPTLSAFNASNALGYFTGTSMEAELETGDADASGKRFMTRAIKPHVEGTSATISCRLGYRDKKDLAPSYTSLVGLNRYGVSPVRKNARYTRAIVNVAAGGTWEQLQGFEFDQVDAGSM